MAKTKEPVYTKQDRGRAVTQVLAISRLEGFEPDTRYLALLERYITGEITTADIHRILDVVEESQNIDAHADVIDGYTLGQGQV